MLTQRLAQFVVDTALADLPPAALDHARNAFIDTVGCGLAGTTEPVGRLAIQWAQDAGTRAQCAVWGTAQGASPAMAAYVNGVTSHALDFDDAMPTLRGHPSTTLVPAALAVGQAAGASGEAVLAAYVLGLEIAGKLGAAVGDGHYFRGWHTTSTIGTLAATAVAGRLWGLTADELRTAWGLAASQASGLVCNFGSMVKPMHAGHAASCGVQAAWMARHGLSAQASIFDVEGGFMSTYGGGDGPPLAELAGRLGQPWEIFEPGVFVKRWPCCYANHRIIGGILALMAEHGIEAGEIEAIEAGFLPGGDSALISRDPRRGLEGKFSIEYVAAALVLDGKITLGSFTDDMLARPAVRALMAKVHRRRIESDGVYSGLKGYSEVSILTRSRGRYDCRVDRTPGSPAWPLTDADFAQKFMDCAGLALGEAAARQVLALLQDLRSLPGVQDLAQATLRQ